MSIAPIDEIVSIEAFIPVIMSQHQNFSIERMLTSIKVRVLRSKGDDHRCAIVLACLAAARPDSPIQEIYDAVRPLSFPEIFSNLRAVCLVDSAIFHGDIDELSSVYSNYYLGTRLLDEEKLEAIRLRAFDYLQKNSESKTALWLVNATSDMNRYCPVRGMAG